MKQWLMAACLLLPACGAQDTADVNAAVADCAPLLNHIYLQDGERCYFQGEHYAAEPGELHCQNGQFSYLDQYWESGRILGQTYFGATVHCE